MEFGFTKEQEDFRQEVCEFCQKEPWGEITPEAEEPFYSLPFCQKVVEKGWPGIPYPKEYGGQGKGALYETIFMEGISCGGVPPAVIIYFSIIAHCANLILKCGTEHQKKEYLPRIIRGEARATQMYTEPEAGSNLASVQTTAVRKGDYYLVNGQKMFTTHMYVPYAILMARTDPSAPLEKGISLFMLDNGLPGISYTPIANICDFTTNQVFLDNVKIPRENLIGEENRGWDYFMRIKPYYWHKARISVFADWQKAFDALVKYVRETKSNGHPLSQNPTVRRKIAEMAIDLKVLRLLTYRLAWMLSEGLDAFDCATILKIIGDDISLRLGNNAMQVLGLTGQLGGGVSYAPLSGMMELIYRYNCVFHFVDSGGASTAKNFLATHGLGLPEF